MIHSRPSIFHTIDWWIAGIFIAMLIFGWFSICGASYTYGETDIFSLSSRSGMQLLWIGTALLLGLIIMLLDNHLFDALGYILYGAMLVILFLTIFNPKQIHGSRSWLVLGPVQVQPAEFAKFTTALAIAKFMNSYDFNYNRLRHWAMAFAIVLTPMFLIICQKETGSALVYLAFFLMFYREGMSGAILFSSIAFILYFVIGLKYQDTLIWHSTTSAGTFFVLSLIIILSVIFDYVHSENLSESPLFRQPPLRMLAASLAITLLAILFSAFVIPFNVSIVMTILLILIIIYYCFRGLKEDNKKYLLIAAFALGSAGFFASVNYVMNDVMAPYQRARINVLLGVEEDINGIGYNVHQSEIAIGSGGVLGKGFLNGTQTKLKYVPEQDTDFIFCTIGEEEGFLGCVMVLGLFLALILRLIYISEQQATRFGRVYGYCVVGIFTFHVLINVGMVLGLTPVIGIPLPFFSYGGSSLWGFTILLFIFLRLDAERKRAIQL